MIWVLWAIFVIICIGLHLVLQEFSRLSKELGRLQQMTSRDRTTSLVWLKNELKSTIEKLDQQALENRVELRKLSEISRHYGQEKMDQTERLSSQTQEIIRELRQIRLQEPRSSRNNRNRRLDR